MPTAINRGHPRGAVFTAGAPDRVAEAERNLKLVAPGAGSSAVKACNSFSLPRFFKVSSSS